MSFHRRMTRPDATQGEIIAGLRAAGITVWVIGQPCDLLTYYPPLKRWRPLEAKPVKQRARGDQESQSAFLARFAVPIVRSAQEAIEAVTR